MDIRLISLDLDGTALLPDQASFSQRTEEALLAAHRQGVAIVPTTGRQFAGDPPPGERGGSGVPLYDGGDAPAPH